MEKHRDICGMAVNVWAIPRREHVRGRRFPRRHPWTLPCPRISTCTGTRSGGDTIARGSGGGRPEADMRMSVESRGIPGTYLTCL